MGLSDAERVELTTMMRVGETAGAALPFLRRLVQTDRVDDVPEAVAVASGSMEVFRPQGRTFLAHQVPALIMQEYWPRKVPRERLEDFVAGTIANKEWSQQIVDAVTTGDGTRLVKVVADVEARGGGR